VAAAFHRIQHLRGKNEEMTPKSLVQSITPQAPCHLAPFSAAPRTLLVAALTHHRWVCRGKRSTSKQKAPNPAIFSPDKITEDNNTRSPCLYPLCNILAFQPPGLVPKPLTENKGLTRVTETFSK